MPRPTFRRDRLLPVLIAAVLALLTGCASVPESSDLQVVRSLPVASQPAPPAGPQPGADPFRLVRDFIEATGSAMNGHAAARAFLTQDAAASWNDAAGLTVIEDAPGAVPEASPVDGVRRIRVGGAQLGVLAADGSFTPQADTFSVQFEVVKERGEWRITNPPSGVFVESSAFQLNYRQVRVSFIAPDRGILVSDMRWVPAHPIATLPGRALDLLLGGPSEGLRGAVISALPFGATPRSNVLAGSDGRTSINLTGLGGLSEWERRLAAAQIVNTLDGLVSAPLRLLADSEPLVPGQVEWRMSDITAYTSAAGPRPDAPGQVVVEKRLRGLDGAPVPGPVGDGELTVLSAARSSPGGELLAVVVSGPDGRPQLRVGAADRTLSTVPLAAESMTRPTWRPSGTEVWTVINGRTVAGVVLSDTGPPATYQVNTAELDGLGPITELRLSRDGVRVAAVVGGKLVVAAVVTEPEEVSLRQPRILREKSLPPAAGVDWARSEALVMASADPSPRVFSVSVDGLVRRQFASTNLTGPLTAVVAAPGREILVADVTGVWAYSELEEEWEPLLSSRPGSGAVVPIYPG